MSIEKKRMDQLILIKRRALGNLSTTRRCYEYDDFVEIGEKIESEIAPFIGLPLTALLRVLQIGIWLAYPEVVELIDVYIDFSEGHLKKNVTNILKTLCVFKNKFKIVDIEVVYFHNFLKNFLSNLRKLSITFKTPKKVLTRRRAMKARKARITEALMAGKKTVVLDIEGLDSAFTSNPIQRNTIPVLSSQTLSLSASNADSFVRVDSFDFDCLSNSPSMIESACFYSDFD